MRFAITTLITLILSSSLLLLVGCEKKDDDNSCDQLEIEECDKQLLPTMSATVEIIVDELKDVIAIPFSALIERDGKSFARVLQDGRVVEREIQTGQTVRSKVVVTEGLSEGDVVCLR